VTIDAYGDDEDRFSADLADLYFDPFPLENRLIQAWYWSLRDARRNGSL